jgi:penicillin-binding protein 1A
MDEYMDAWFVGYTPSLTCGVWVGYDEKKPIGPAMTGAQAALPAWTDFMIAAARGRPVEDFPLPSGSTSREICVETGMLATVNCPAVTTEIFSEGAEPTEACSSHPGPLLKPATPGAPAAEPRRPEDHDTEQQRGTPLGAPGTHTEIH